ncbi:MAG: sulfatase-like hydrolase/transferase, partial [bacterium]
HYMSVATHHPYSYPRDLAVPFSSDNNHRKYRNTLFYTDKLVGKVVEDICRLQDGETQTLLMIAGDHGQAFGKRHKGNFTHKNFLYEENLRSFWLVAPACKRGPPPALTGMPGSLSDIYPTLSEWMGEDVSTGFGATLMDRPSRSRPVFFYKNSIPAQWGVLDGQWKYISEMRGDGTELYNLDSDPIESVNLAHIYPERLEQYRDRVESWYLSTDYNFRRSLKDYQFIGGKGLSKGAQSEPGPKLISLGVREGGRFSEAQTLSIGKEVWAWTQWVPYGDDQVIEYNWVAPSGNMYRHPFAVRKGWSRTLVRKDFGEVDEVGVWTLQLMKDSEVIAEQTFTVKQGY